MSSPDVVIIGSGHAGVQAAASLREEGFDSAVTLLSDEPALPYQRPPLSKGFIKGALDVAGLPLRAEQFYRENRIDLRLDETAARIDRVARSIELASGRKIPFGRLVIATGARSRPLAAPGVDLDGVFALRDIADALALRERLPQARRVVVIGAGFIGLEIAATAASFGGAVDIVEIAPRPLGRAVSPMISAFFLSAHKAFGATFHLGLGVRALHGAAGAVREVELTDGLRLPADLVVVGVGVLAQDQLACEAGLDCDNGIVVNDLLETSDPMISAIGDCAQFPSSWLGFSVRLESVQNAVDQARCLARRLVGKPEPYRALPWFWSDQGDLKLQIAGLSQGVDQWVERGDPASRAFSVLGYRNGALAAVETVNRGADHMASRRLIEKGVSLTPADAADPQFDLRKLALAAGR